ncbi:MAG TPA: 5'-nucleotidase C-terminal domain-containing protein, partial [Thermoanaerobaculaceae bacterium]|nr:5'-nucleotidase C-terminal domain-containing protein [Thermoanaerobaculaceae bacterium]
PEQPSYNYDTLEGATYYVDPSAPVGTRVQGLRVAGKAVQSGDTFTLAVNSYRAAGGGSYPHLAGAPRVTEIDRPMVELLVEYFVRHGTITPGTDENWSFTVPLREAQAPRPKAAVQ